VHNLRAAANVQFLRAIYPDAVIAMYYHGGEVPGVPTPSVQTVQATFDVFDVVFTNTESSRKHAIGRGGAADRIVVSPVGFDLRGFPDPEARSYRRDGRLNVFMVGRMSEEKGFLLGLRALKVLIEEGHDIKVRLGGDGPLRQQIESFIAEHRLQGHIEMLGFVDNEQLRRCYTEADVFLLPSIPVGTWEENQACVVQEAMLMRAVVAVSRTGGVGESTAPSMLPYSFEPGSVEGMVAGLRKLARLTEQELRSLGAQGRAFAQGRYDIRVLNAELLAAAVADIRDTLDDDAEEAAEAA
jgi:colanic acid/amylovoran biosynthesis glycosyltransferase